MIPLRVAEVCLELAQRSAIGQDLRARAAGLVMVSRVDATCVDTASPRI